MEVVASLSQCRKAAAQCGLFTHKSVPVIFEPPCTCTPFRQCNSNFCICLSLTQPTNKLSLDKKTGGVGVGVVFTSLPQFMPVQNSTDQIEGSDCILHLVVSEIQDK